MFSQKISKGITKCSLPKYVERLVRYRLLSEMHYERTRDSGHEYQHCLEIKKKFFIARIVKVTNRVWRACDNSGFSNFAALSHEEGGLTWKLTLFSAEGCTKELQMSFPTYIIL